MALPTRLHTITPVEDHDGDGIDDWMGMASVPTLASGADLSEMFTPEGDGISWYLEAMAPVGDMCGGDGRPDMVVGAVWEEETGMDDWEYYPMLQLYSSIYVDYPEIAWFGSSDLHLAGGFDADGDGEPDLLVGEPPRHAVWVLQGCHDSPSGWIVAPSHLGFGTDVAYVADVTGDGRGDLAVMSEEAVLVYELPLAQISDDEDAVAIVTFERELGDLDGDGNPDLVVHGDDGLYAVFGPIVGEGVEPSLLVAGAIGALAVVEDGDGDGTSEIFLADGATGYLLH